MNGGAPDGGASHGSAPDGGASVTPAPRASAAGVLRLVHLFPSILTAVATAVIAALAGADAPTAGRLGVAMFGMQCSIGALNDIIDTPLDGREKPRKPIPSGAVTVRAAWMVAGAGAIVGLGLAAVSGGATFAAAIAVLALGYVYDLRLSRTALSWLPLSLALPVLPAFAWLGATGHLPVGLVTLLPVAVLAGAGLSIANGLVDVERDSRAGRRPVAVRLGGRRAWALQSLLLGGAAGLALVLAPAVPDLGSGVELPLLRVARLGGLVTGLAVIGLGAIALRALRPGLRERGWELEAVGVALMGLGWFVGLAAAAGEGSGT